MWSWQGWERRGAGTENLAGNSLHLFVCWQQVMSFITSEQAAGAGAASSHYPQVKPSKYQQTEMNKSHHTHQSSFHFYKQFLPTRDVFKIFLHNFLLFVNLQNYLVKISLNAPLWQNESVMSRPHFLSPKVLGSNDLPLSNCHLIADNEIFKTTNN